MAPSRVTRLETAITRRMVETCVETCLDFFQCGGFLSKGIAKNDWINFKVPGHPGQGIIARVRRVRYFATFEAMIREVGIKYLLPNRAGMSVADAVALYKKFANQRGTYAEMEKQHGAVAIDVDPLEPTTLEPTCLTDEQIALNLHEELNLQFLRGR